VLFRRQSRLAGPPGGAHPVPDASGALRSNAIGVSHIVFFVVSAAAPLSGVVLGVPVIIGQGNGIGAAGSFVVVTVVLLLFAVGYSAMSRHIVNAGGFYTYVAQGLGRVSGLGAATLALFAYTAIQAGMFGALGAYVDRFVRSYLGFGLAWWAYSLAGVALCVALGVRRVDVGARILGVVLVLETVLILALDAVIFVTGGARGGGVTALSWEPFSPAAVWGGALGIALVFAHTSFIGFESTVIYGEEARRPRRTVPRATYVALVAMGAFYAISTWLLTNAFPAADVVGIARDDPESFAAQALESRLGAASADVMSVLIITSIFAAVLAFHNTLARYLFALGRQGLVWKALGRTHSVRQSPHVACYVQAATAVVVIVAFAVAGADPYGNLYVWATGLGATGIIVLQLVASVAVFTFFRRHDVDKRRWHTVVAPVLGMLGLLVLAVAALSNFGLLIGVPSVGAVVALGAVLLCAALAGMGRAVWLRRNRVTAYARIGDVTDLDVPGLDVPGLDVPGLDEPAR
jgi:amino acid transporter